jgi:ketosteroid isomerase-like protein
MSAVVRPRVLSVLAAAAVISMLVATGRTWPARAEPTSPDSPAARSEAEIREKRERFNRAIIARDTTLLALIWTSDVRVIASNGGRIDGRDAYRDRFAGYFAERRGYSYRRDPARVEVFEPWGIAAEHGRWRAEWQAADGPIDVGGEYLMQWVRTDAGWLVQAEMFVPRHCIGGAYCTTLP